MRKQFSIISTALLILVLLLIAATAAGCGDLEKAYDSANYESLSNEYGDIEVYSGGRMIKNYVNVKILYSSSDTQALFIEQGNKKIYIQGDCIINIK